MIILDTTVISELMRGPAAHQNVRRWLAGLNERPVTTVLNRAEILAGIELLPPGAKQQRLRSCAERAFATLGATIPLTTTACDRYATVVATSVRSGRTIGTMNALIAAIALDAGAALASRDHGFTGLGLIFLNPWKG